MARIAWNPIAIPEIGSEAIRAQSMAGASIQQALGSFGGLINQWEGDRRDDNLAELYTRQNIFARDNNVDGYQSQLASGGLTQGLSYLRPQDIVAARAYAGDLRSARNADTSYAQGNTRFANEQTQFGQSQEDRTRRLAETENFNKAFPEVLPLFEEVRRTGRADSLLPALRDIGVRNGLTGEQLNDFMTKGFSYAQEGRAVESHDLNQRRGIQGLEQDSITFGQGQEARTEGRNVDALLASVTGIAGAAIADKAPGGGAELALKQAIQSGNFNPREIAAVASRLGVSAPIEVLAALQAEGPGNNPSFAGRNVSGSGNWTEQSGMAASESGGNWGITNSEGYGGRNQFGAARLEDAFNAGILPRKMTGREFAALPPEQQIAVENWHWSDIDRQAERRGLNRFIGQTVGGVPVTQAAIRGMAQIGGITGAKRFLETGGRYNPDDSNGTSIRDYGQRFSGRAINNGPTPAADSRWGGSTATNARDLQTQGIQAQNRGVPLNLGDPANPTSFISAAESMMTRTQQALARQGGAVGQSSAARYAETQAVGSQPAGTVAASGLKEGGVFHGSGVNQTQLANAITQLKREVGGSMTESTALRILSESTIDGRNLLGRATGNVRALGGGNSVDMVKAAQIARSLGREGGANLAENAASSQRGMRRASELLSTFDTTLARYRASVAADATNYPAGQISNVTQGYGQQLIALQEQIQGFTETAQANARSFAGENQPAAAPRVNAVGARRPGETAQQFVDRARATVPTGPVPVYSGPSPASGDRTPEQLNRARAARERIVNDTIGRLGLFGDIVAPLVNTRLNQIDRTRQ